MNDLTVVETPANWDRLKAMVLDSVSSPITRRVYNMALEEFLAWFRQAPRPGFTKATVSAWRAPNSDSAPKRRSCADWWTPIQIASSKGPRS
ncbi:MAG TPA: hypothetical protein VMB85_26705 [Bryobacteraceae bacterium]|nr:hypothetical protein [Bryobacteraceae bacterium]